MIPRSQIAALSHPPRPILSIETCGHGAVRNPLSIPRDVPPGADGRAIPISRTMGDGPAVPPNHVKTTGSKPHLHAYSTTHSSSFTRVFQIKDKKNYRCMQFLPLYVAEDFVQVGGTETIVSQLVNLNVTVDVLPAVSASSVRTPVITCRRPANDATPTDARRMKASLKAVRRRDRRMSMIRRSPLRCLPNPCRGGAPTSRSVRF